VRLSENQGIDPLTEAINQVVDKVNTRLGSSLEQLQSITLNTIRETGWSNFLPAAYRAKLKACATAGFHRLIGIAEILTYRQHYFKVVL
jgi:hypothetical protein